MKNLFFSLVLFSFAAVNFVSFAQSGKEFPVRVFITAGQSNTDGRVNNKLLPPYIKVMATDTVEYQKGQYQFCKISQNRIDGLFLPYWPKGRITEGLWTYDAVTYSRIEKAIQEDFYVIKWAVGGTSIAYPNDTIKGRYWSANPEWLENTQSTAKQGKSLLLSFTEAIDASIDQTLSKIERGYHIDAFLWHQGESDSKYAGDYYENLKAVINHVRDHLTKKTAEDYSDLPFIFGSVPKSNRYYRPEIDAAMRRIAKEDSNAYLVDMSEGELQKDQIHFNERSAESLGLEMYRLLDKMLDLSAIDFYIAKYKDDKACAISYTFDDGLKEHYTLVAPEMEKHGFRGTFWVNGATINEDALKDTSRMSWRNLKEMAVNGHEISNHGWSHKNMNRLTIEEMKREIEMNDSAIFFHTGILPRTFCYPYNAKNDSALAVASANRIDTRTRQFSIGGKSTMENLEMKVAELLEKKEWGITMTHGITHGYDHFSSDNIFWDHLKKVKDQEERIWVGTFQEVASYVNQQKAITYDIEKRENGFILTPYLSLNQDLYSIPLTGVIVRKNIDEITVRQGNKRLNVRVLPDKFLFDFDPFGEPVEFEIKKSE